MWRRVCDAVYVYVTYHYVAMWRRACNAVYVYVTYHYVAMWRRVCNATVYVAIIVTVTGGGVRPVGGKSKKQIELESVPEPVFSYVDLDQTKKSQIIEAAKLAFLAYKKGDVQHWKGHSLSLSLPLPLHLSLSLSLLPISNGISLSLSLLLPSSPRE